MGNIGGNEAKRLLKKIKEILNSKEPDTWTVYDSTTGKPLFTFDNHWFDKYLEVKNKED